MYDFCIWSHACFVGKNPKTARLAKVTSVVRESSVSGYIGSNSGHHLGAIVLWCAIGLRGPSVGSRWCPGTTAIRLIGVIFQYLSIYFPDFQNIQENIFKNFWETKGFFFVDLIDTLNCTYNHAYVLHLIFYCWFFCCVSLPERSRRAMKLRQAYPRNFIQAILLMEGWEEVLFVKGWEEVLFIKGWEEFFY